ncbi:MAG: YqgE/AlgH family protein [Planctomycetes bacterium]|nr:YqgE/AlgH family protein [Planctomycetota bacterium]
MPQSLRGKCLVAANSLRDSNFRKTVVLMLDHNDQGATGLILNRPSSIRVAHALSGHFSLPDSEQVVYMGGPVEPSALLMIHDNEDLGESSSSPCSKVFIADSAQSFEQVLLSEGQEESNRSLFRIFSGYSGWSGGQLEGEIERGDWLIHQGCHELVFVTDPYEVYEVAMNLIFKSTSLLPYRIKDPSVN